MTPRIIAALLAIPGLLLTPLASAAVAPGDPDWVETRERIVVELRGDRERVPPHLLEPTNLDILLQHVLETYRKGRYQGELPDSRSARRSVADEAADILEDHADDLEDLADLENELRPMYPVLGIDPAAPAPLTLPGWPETREAVLADLDGDTPDATTLDPGFAGLDALILRQLRRRHREPEDLAGETYQRSVARAVTRPYEELLTLRQRVRRTAALWPAPPSPENDDAYQPVDDPDWAAIREQVPLTARILNDNPAYAFLDARVVDGLIRERIDRRHDGKIPDDPHDRERLIRGVARDYLTDYLVSRPGLEALEAQVRARFANPVISEREDDMVVVDLGLVPGAVVPGRRDVPGPMTEVPIIPVVDPTAFRVGRLLEEYRERYPQAEPLGLVFEFYRGRGEEARAYYHFQRGDRIIVVEVGGGRTDIRYRASPELGGLARVVDADGQLLVEDWLRVYPPQPRQRSGGTWRGPAPRWVHEVLRELGYRLRVR